MSEPACGQAGKRAALAVGTKEWLSHLDHCSGRDVLAAELQGCLELLPNGAGACALFERLQDLQAECDASASAAVGVMEAALLALSRTGRNAP